MRASGSGVWRRTRSLRHNSIIEIQLEIPYTRKKVPNWLLAMFVHNISTEPNAVLKVKYKPKKVSIELGPCLAADEVGPQRSVWDAVLVEVLKGLQV